MGLLDLIRPNRSEAADDGHEMKRLEAKAKNLRGRLSKNQGELRRLWTEFRTTHEGNDVKKELRARIKRVEAERKTLAKEMRQLQTRIERAGRS